MHKTAIITGSSYGIGEALTKVLLEKEVKVFGYSRTNTITNKNFKYSKIDLSNLNAINGLKLPIIKDSSSVILINNAATVGNILPIDKKSAEDISYEYNLNLLSPALLTKNFISSYKKNNKLIINISSGAAKKSIAGWSTYCSSKAAIDSFTQAINQENHHKLRAISIYPGIVNTKMQESIRKAPPASFPLLNKFKKYFEENMLEDPNTVAKKIYEIISNYNKYRSNIIDIRDI